MIVRQLLGNPSRPPVYSGGMPEKILPTLNAYLWDLRVQCESQLRALTLAQRLLEEYREARTAAARSKVKRRLQDDLRAIVKTNAVIREAARDVLEQAEQLPPRSEA